MGKIRESFVVSNGSFIDNIQSKALDFVFDFPAITKDTITFR